MELSHSRVAAAGSNVAVSEAFAGALVFGAGDSRGIFACPGFGIGGTVGSCGNTVAAKVSMVKTSQNRFIGRP